MHGTPALVRLSIHAAWAGRICIAGEADFNSIQPDTPRHTKDRSGIPDEYLSSCLWGKKSSGIRRFSVSHTRCSGSRITNSVTRVDSQKQLVVH